MPSGTTYNPTHVNEFEKSKLFGNGLKVQGLAAAGTTTDFDLDLTDDNMFTGVWFIVRNGNLGDSAVLQVIDHAGVTGHGPDVLLGQFVDWGVPDTCDEQLDFVYPAKLLAGFRLRLVYTSTGAVQPFVICNYKLHKVLV